MFGPLVGGEWLAAHLDDEDLRLLDVRWYSDGRSGRAAYDAGHIPGAVFIDLERDLSGHRPNAGRHPLPEREVFQEAMRAGGVGQASTVVAYDDQGGASACRLWWLLRYFGHDRVAVLDGGLRASGGRLSADAHQPPSGDFTASAPHGEMVVDYEAVRARSADTLLIDARASERFRGEKEPLDPVAGHIPGAVNAFYQANLGSDQRFLPPAELRRRYDAIGVKDDVAAVAYCGSGVTACHDLLAMEVAGFRGGRLYPGSWSEWCGRPGAPVATGAD
jgi:thiosulfate/3-mercaptopyruvate sulfurtransferase